MARYRQRQPSEVEALQFDGSLASARLINEWLNPSEHGRPSIEIDVRGDLDAIGVRHSGGRGVLTLHPGDYAVRDKGQYGEPSRWPSEDFQRDYEPAD